MEPASIRYNNPGAMWGGNAISRKWGEKSNVVLNDGKGQNNHIAGFPTKIHGAAAQIDLWRTERYHNKKFRDAIAIWSGGNSVQQYIDFVISRVPGMTRDTLITDEFLSSAAGVAFLKAQAWHEAGKPYPMVDADWERAQQMVFKGAKPPMTPKMKVATAVVATTSVVATAAVPTAQNAAASGHTGLTVVLILLSGIAIFGGGIWFFLHHKKKEAV